MPDQLEMTDAFNNWREWRDLIDCPPSCWGEDSRLLKGLWDPPASSQLPQPPLRWQKPVIQRAVLEKSDAEVAYWKNQIEECTGMAYSDRGRAYEEATTAFCLEKIQNHLIRRDLGLN